MQPPTRRVSDELAQAVWASVILSLQNPYTITASDEYSQRNQEDNDIDCDLEEDDNKEDTEFADLISVKTGQLTSTGDKLGQKFLDCISELLSHPKREKRREAAERESQKLREERRILPSIGWSAGNLVFRLTEVLRNVPDATRTEL
ncbi:hypothetical protein BJY01DRAFT_250922 [Aspergillus pseudoustus]|uniref:Uncharacterized protein n=1 Tax=Aspergillus pseudoustus TaxID=1810923 RepID=A0ABR4JF22_9EURO